MKFLPLFYCLSLPFISFLQEDSIQKINEVQAVDKIHRLKIKEWRHIVFTQKEIELLAPIDLGELLNKTIGANVKSYGGLGGLKTVSFRGMGANHTSIVVDGFPLQNNQTGQVNLGNIQVDNIVSVQDDQYSSSINIPVSANVHGAMFAIKTFESSFSQDTLMIRNSNTIGSFGQEKVYLGAKFGNTKFYFSAFGNYTQSEGEYQYRLKNGNILIDEKRQNNDYLQFNSGIGGGFAFKNVKVRMFGNYMKSSQGLPGAVIFYNQTEDSRLDIENYKFGLDVKYSLDKNVFRTYANFNSNQTNYHDPTVLNNWGFIENNFQNQTYLIGVKGFSKLTSRYSLNYGAEWNRGSLQSNEDGFGVPKRDYFVAMLGFTGRYERFQVNLTPSYQLLQDKRSSSKSNYQKYIFTPLFNADYELIKKKLSAVVEFKRTFRMPSFNDLYYSGIGNDDLLPEKAIQIRVGLKNIYQKKKFAVKSVVNGYFNRIEDKIVAIPTQNLFVWSMTNVGIVNVIGGELNSEMDVYLSDKLSLLLNLGYSYQLTRDFTSKESILYKNIIPYSPEHTLNAGVSFAFHDFTLRVSNQFVSYRYALYENIDNNLIDGFFLTDVVFKYSKRLNKHQLSVLCGVKNIFDQSYEVVRYYVMPQRNYFLSLKYAFN